MKLYLIAALFLATLVVVPCLAEEEIKNAETANVHVSVADLPEDKPVESQEKKESDEDVPEEFKDEVEQVKRGYPQLSRQSCLILQRYGYCSNKAIARFCVNICSCIDKLSSLSCRKVKYTYRACNQTVGRVYCKKNCNHCRDELPQCRNYTSINDITRRQSRGGGSKCDRNIRVGWYRFIGLTGTYIPTRCVAPNHCGTSATGWVNGSYPSSKGQTLNRQVCFSWSGNCCRWKINIKITNCGGFYVFYLKKTLCNFRYCGNA